MADSATLNPPVVEILATLTLTSSGIITSCDCSLGSHFPEEFAANRSIREFFPGLMDAIKTELRVNSTRNQTALISSLPGTQQSCLVQVQQIDSADSPYRVYVLADHFALGSVQIRQKRLEIIARSLYTSHLDALVTIDGDSIIHEFSPSAEILFGYSREEAIGRHVADIVIPPNMRDAHNQGMSRFHATREGPVINTRIEIEAIRRNGETFPCELTVVPTEEYQGTTYFTASIRDISDSKAREAALEKAKEIAEASNQAKSRFLAHMSHEIRSPLNAVIGCMDLLLDSGLTKEQLPFAETSLKAGHALLGIVEDVLDFSKIEAGEQKITAKVFNLVELCEQVSEVISIRAGAKEIHIGCCMDPNIPAELISDPSHIRRILTNLLDNAIKFTDIGGVSLNVRLGDIDPEHQHVDIVFEISDTGIGIPIESQKRLFQEFSQVDNSDTASYGGTGLGLAICKELTELLGGRISLKSEANCGSKFTVIIPFQTTLEHKKALRQLTTKAQIYVLSDNKSFKSAIDEQCRKLGTYCEFIETGTKPRDVTDEHLIIVDASSSQFNLAITELSRTLGIRKQNILLYSRPYAPDLIVAAKAEGLQHILQRPLKASSLIHQLNLMMGNTSLASAKPEPQASSHTRDTKAPGKILLAEDNSANQLVAKTMLTRAGYQIDIANNGLEAIAALSKAEYDLVLMDVRMPKLDGISATQEIRNSDAKWATIPIIAMTANAFDTDIERCLASGMNGFLPKPVNRKDLIDMVAKFSLGTGDSPDQAPEVAGTIHSKNYLDVTVVNRLIADTSAEAAAAIMGMFTQELEKFAAYIAQPPNPVELKPIREMAHSCKSSAGYCGALPFQRLAQSIETACDLQDKAAVTAYLLKLPATIQETVFAIHEQVKQLTEQ